MENKKSIFFATILIIPLILVISFLAVRGAGQSREMVAFSLFGGAELRNVIEIPLSEADHVEVAYTSKNVKIYPTDGDQIIIKEYLISKSEEAKATVTKEEGASGERTVVVTGGKKQVITFLYLGAGEKIEIYLPEEGIDSFALQTSSGNITAEESLACKAERLSVTASSGNIKWRNTEAAEMVFETGSGNISVSHLVGKAVLQAGSGNIKVEELSGGVAVQTGSGNITIEDFSGAGNASAGSGNIRLDAEEVTGDLSLETGSGNIKLGLPEALSFSLEVQTGSGNIRTSFDDMLSYNKKGNYATGTVGTQPSCMVQVAANSGNVTIAAE